MSASAVRVDTYIFSDPSWTIGTGQTTTAAPLDSTLSLPPIFSTSIVTLSSGTSYPGVDITGLLYTPDLADGDPCIAASRPYVPGNVTRQGSLPNEDYNLIALAPWISANCTLNYLSAAQQDPVHGFMFFTLNASDYSIPAGPDDPRWNLGDGGAWKSLNKYPVYVVSGAVGHTLMNESVLYSGNLTGVPYGHQLAQLYDARDYVRLRVDIILNASNSLPSLWVFLLIVLGILVGVIVSTLLFMRCLQRRRRHTLRQRIINGDVDLEALGIQRLIVPKELLDRMPVFEYGAAGKTILPEHDHTGIEKQDSSSSDGTTKTRSAERIVPASMRRPRFENHQNQSTCAICLDDFVSSSTEAPGCAVRQLPCHHIFHPECVDSFLRENSSLCPMCKSSALPRGYCPKVITNAMVRRERTIRRMRERVDESDFPPMREEVGRLARLRAMLPGNRASREDSITELSHTGPYLHPGPQTRIEIPPPTGTTRRREWARQRAVAMLGRRQLTDEAATTPRSSRWRKFLGGVFPGIE